MPPNIEILAMLNKQQWIIAGALLVVVAAVLPLSRLGATASAALHGGKPDYLRAVYSPLHFKPAIETATDAQCLACHQEVLDDTVRERSPAGIPAAGSQAWYQRLSTYQGAQDTFHRRHLTSAYARREMNLSCNTCHQGQDPRDEAPGSSATTPPQTDVGFTLRKQVNPETTCLKCHGQMPWQNMGLPGSWADPTVSAAFTNSCTSACHSTIRTNRHNVTYLNHDAIEADGAKNADVCFGCHGGRPWYRISYPYPRHPWPGMPEVTPDWAKNRPTESEARFIPQDHGRSFKP